MTCKDLELLNIYQYLQIIVATGIPLRVSSGHIQHQKHLYHFTAASYSPRDVGLETVLLHVMKQTKSLLPAQSQAGYQVPHGSYWCLH